MFHEYLGWYIIVMTLITGATYLFDSMDGATITKKQIKGLITTGILISILMFGIYLVN